MGNTRFDPATGCIVSGGGLKKLEEGFFAPDAHVVGVDRVTHLLFFPLQDIGGRPVLRIARYAGR